MRGWWAMAETVGDQVLARLREWGVEQVFAYPGDGINGILTAFDRADDDRTAAKFWVVALLDRRVERVEVSVEDRRPLEHEHMFA